MREPPHLTNSSWPVFLAFLRLGFTSFGGPVAHLAYFRDEFVSRRRWVDERRYADLVALCQFLPGPASSQVGMALGLLRAGYRGALAAWLGFTLPSAVAMMGLATLLAYASALHGDTSWRPVLSGALHGLKLAAVAVVAQAVWSMWRAYVTDRLRTGIALMAAVTIGAWASPWAPWGVMVVAAGIGLLLHRPHHASTGDVSAASAPQPEASTEGPSAVPRCVQPSARAGVLALALFALLLVVLPWLAAEFPGPALAMSEAFYRAGSLVFGGGHVVLPLLQGEVVSRGWVSNDTFLAGYGAAQALPGPLFSFAAFLGASAQTGAVPAGAWAGWIGIEGWSSAWGGLGGSLSGLLGGLLGLVAIFSPAFLLVVGAMPFWESLRSQARAQAALASIHAAVVGVLLAAWVHPVCTSSIDRPQHLAWAGVGFAALMWARWPPWLVVLACGALGAVGL
jgi:chromate transporter